jgi:hypothetical protein
MKEKIYTIPVNDAFRRNDRDCPLCSLEESLGAQMLDYYLGPSLMEPDVRGSTNDQGFCRLHAQGLFDRENNRLGLGLMLHTHLGSVSKVVESALREAAIQPRKGFSGRQKDFRDKIRASADTIRKQASSCVICDRLAATMARYIEVICWQYVNEPGFRDTFLSTHHFCIPHFADLLEGAAQHLDQNEASAFLEDVRSVASRALGEMERDIEWFTLKFDYRNADKPWENSKDAVVRTIRTLTGGTLPEKQGSP